MSDKSAGESSARANRDKARDKADLPAQPQPALPETATKHDGATEHGGRKGPDPVRYGDWEKNGRCIDF